MIGLRDGEIHVWRAGALQPRDVHSVCARYLDRPFLVVRSVLGKPFVAGGALEIGVAHTQGASIVAVSRRPVGIDLERMAPLADLGPLVRASLTEAETRELEGLGADDRTARFYRCWVRKEALLKARGCGLTVDPRDVDTTKAPHGWTWIDATLDGTIAVSVATPDRRAVLSWMTFA